MDIYTSRFKNFIPSKYYLRHYHRLIMNQEPNYKNPTTFHEKLNYLKMHYRNPIQTTVVDKYAVREYIKETIGEEYLIPLIGVYDKFDDIKFKDLPNKFVIKCNHDSGSYIVVRNKKELDRKAAKEKIDNAMKQNYYYRWREWPYKNIKPKVIVEKYMEDNESKSLDDYKFMCFNGNVDSVMVCTNRKSGNPYFYFFDKDWNLKKYNPKTLARAPKELPEKPPIIDKMFELAEKLSQGFPFVRVDLYCCNHKIYFGELTFYPQAGWDGNIEPDIDKLWGDMLILPNKKTQD